MAVDLRKVKKLIELVEESGIAELEVSSGDESIRIAMNRQNLGSSVVVTPQNLESSKAAPAPDAAKATQKEQAAQITNLVSPMAGTFYVAPDPEAPAFIEIGQKIAVGDTICIIESMKMMHTVQATESGVVQTRCVENGQPIGTGDVLFHLV